MKLNKALELRKSKYIKRWKGKDNKYHYKYARKKVEKEKKGERLITRLKVREDIIRNLQYEKCYVYNKQGDIIFRKTGESDHIFFTDKEYNKFYGCEVFTHNHPTDISFSPDDIKLAFISKMKEMRAAGKKYSYSMKIDQNWKDENEWKGFIDELDNIAEETMDQLRQLIRLKKVSKKDAEDGFWHDVWTEVAKKNKHFTYKRSE